MADHRVESCSQAQLLCIQLRVATSKNRTRAFPHIRLKPFKPLSLSEEAVSLRLNLGCELVGDTSDGEGRDCFLYLVPL
jgi:hypothetical protein